MDQGANAAFSPIVQTSPVFTDARDAMTNATLARPAPPVSDHIVSLSEHSYLIRPVRGSDEPALLDMFSHSSAQDIRLRCLGAIKDFPHLAAARLARYDARREIALVAIDAEGPGPAGIVGVVHLIEGPERPGFAEFDIMVRTDRQGRGIGFQLMKEIMAQAHERELKSVVGYVCNENEAMLLMASELGFHVEGAEAGVVRVVALL
jgi:acetyltransferase